MTTTRVARHIDAPRTRVYRALVDPESVQCWMVPDGMTSHVHSFDACEGGTFRISLTYDLPTTTGKTTAQTDSLHGRFARLVPDTEVVQVVEFESDDPAMQGEMTITYTLSDAAGGGTDLVGVHEGVPPGVSPADNELGWTLSLDKLARLAGDERRDPPIADPPPRLTFLQRRALKDLARFARKRTGEPLTPADWEAYWRYASQPANRAIKRMLRALPSTPRCGYCGAPFGGLGSRIVRPLGYRPSRKNPNICAMCIELAPPGGMTTDVGVLFADLRGFTARSESTTPTKASEELRRFYAHAQEVLFPEAVIDKLIGDEVMALYLPIFLRPRSASVGDDDRRHVAAVMMEHARELLERVGYGTSGGPVLEIGIGLDFGEAFVGNVGNAALHDFTAVGDVINTASRLQSHAAGGEVVLSARLADLLDEPVGVPEQVAVKGKQQPVEARRVTWFASPP